MTSIKKLLNSAKVEPGGLCKCIPLSIIFREKIAFVPNFTVRLKFYPTKERSPIVKSVRKSKVKGIE